MGEARRRKKLLGSQYGKPSSSRSPERTRALLERCSNSRIAIFSAEETNRKTEQRSLSRPPISELAHLRSKITSIELENWVVAQWNNLDGFRKLVSEEEACRNASVIPRKLYNDFQSDPNQDFSVSCNIRSLIQIAVGINVYSSTIWAFVGDCEGSEYVTLDADEFQLSSMI